MVHHGWVYFLQGNGLTKIGKSTRKPEKRTAEYSPKLPFDTEIVYDIECEDVDAVEKFFHEQFSNSWVRGEWFRLGGSNLLAVQCGWFEEMAVYNSEEDPDENWERQKAFLRGRQNAFQIFEEIMSAGPLWGFRFLTFPNGAPYVKIYG